MGQPEPGNHQHHHEPAMPESYPEPMFSDEPRFHSEPTRTAESVGTHATPPFDESLNNAAQELQRLRDELDAERKKAADAWDQFLRAKADAENARRRAQEDVAKAHKFGIERFAESLVPVMDSLDAALLVQNATAQSMREGIEITMRQLGAAFEKNGLARLDPVGQKFDPHKHQAIAMVPADAEPNTVVSVMQKGYMLADRVLRPALVSVAAPRT